MAVLPGVLGCRPLRRTVQVRLGTDTLRLPGGTPIFAVSRQQFMKYPGWRCRQIWSKSKKYIGRKAMSELWSEKSGSVGRKRGGYFSSEKVSGFTGPVFLP
jgi:hypothetical protein